jgi:hypothetical protein
MNSNFGTPLEDLNDKNNQVFYGEHNKYVDRFNTNFSGNFGSNEAPCAKTGGAARRKRKTCKKLKIKNVGLVHKKHTSMFPHKEIKMLKKKILTLRSIAMPGTSVVRATKKRRVSKGKKTKARKTKGKKSAKQRGGSYGLGGTLNPHELGLANPTPHYINK